ncbi:hypothetical protein VULLAG_LOCUS5463 [Vulpes lagopus]
MIERKRQRQRQREREREAETQEEREAGSMPGACCGLDPRTPGSRPGPKAGAKPLSHPGTPQDQFSLMSLPVDKISWLKIIKRLFRKMLWEGGLNLLMLRLGIRFSCNILPCLHAAG